MKLRWITPTLLLAVASLASAQASSDALIQQTFKTGVEGWIGVGGTAKLTNSHEAGIVNDGAGALKCGYEIKAGDLNAAFLPTPLGSLKDAKSMKLRVRADSNTLMVVLLQEQDGGRYTALVNAPKDTWQPVELSTSDFHLSRDPNDPKDPNARLDMDKVAGIAVGDLAQFFAQIPDPALKKAFQVAPGAHSFYVDGFTVSTTAITGSSVSTDQDVVLENYSHPQLAWFGLSGMLLSQVEGKPLEGTVMKAVYNQAQDQFAAMTRSVAPWILTSTKGISFDVASVRPTKLMVQLEQIDGNKFNVLMDIPGDSTPKNIKLNYSDFKIGEDSKDLSAKLQVEKVKTLLILDGYGFVQNGAGQNTLWIGKIHAFSK